MTTDTIRQSLRRAYHAFSSRPRLVRAVRNSFVLLIAGYLAYRLTDIGWADVAKALPTNPLYYLFVLLAYANLPVADSLIYSRFWNVSVGQIFPPILRKRILNADVLGYSGDVYLFAWATSRLKMARRTVASAIKDNLIISSIASLGTAGALLGVLLATDQILITSFVENPTPLVIAGAIIVGAVILAIYLQAHRILFSLPREMLRWSATINVGRFLFGFVVTVLQWIVVVPGVPFASWATLLAVMVLVNRIPFLPSRDLLFATLGIELSAAIGVPAATIAGLLLVRSAVDRILNLALFLLSAREKDVEEAASGDPAPELLVDEH